jgi:hypothetical protein
MEIDAVLKKLAELSLNKKFENTLLRAKKQSFFLFLAKTGSGKSTITNYLLGKEIILKFAGSKLAARYCDLSIQYPKNTKEFAQKLAQWKEISKEKKHRADCILFIFSPADVSWKAYLKKDGTENLEEKSIGQDSEFGKALAEIMPDDTASYEDNLYELLHNTALFEGYNEQYTRQGKRLAETSSGGKSCTREPEIYENAGIIWADCPGYSDTDFIYRINASLSIQRIVQAAHEIKGIIAIVDWDDVDSGRHQTVEELGIFFGTFFKELKGVPILFLVNKCMPSPESPPITKTFFLKFIEKRIKETNEKYSQAQQSLVQGLTDDGEVKKLMVCYEVFHIIKARPDDIIFVNLSNDTTQRELLVWVKKWCDQVVNKEVFDFRKDQDRASIGHLIDVKAPNWIRSIDNYIALKNKIAVSKEKLEIKKTLLASKKSIATVKINAHTTIHASSIQLLNIKSDYEGIQNRLKNLNARKDDLLTEQTMLEKECETLKKSEELVSLCTVQIKKKNENTSFFSRIWRGNILVPIRYSNVEKHPYDVVSISSNLNSNKLKVKSRSKDTYEGVYTVQPGEEVDGQIEFSVKKMNYAPIKRIITDKEHSIKQKESETKELNADIKQVNEINQSLKVTPEQLKKDLDDNKITQEEHDKKMEALEKAFARITEENFEDEIATLEVSISADTKAQEECLAFIESSEESIKRIQQLSGMLKGAEHISGSEIPYLLLSKYDEFCKLRFFQQQSEHIENQEEKENKINAPDIINVSQNIKSFEEKVFVEELMRPKITSDPIWISAMKKSCEENIQLEPKLSFNFYKLVAYQTLCNALEKEKADGSGRQQLISTAFLSLQKSIELNYSASGFLINLAIHIICKEIQIAVIDHSGLTKLVKDFLDYFTVIPLIKKYAFPLLVACIEAQNQALLEYIITNHNIDSNMCDEEGHHLFDYIAHKSTTDDNKIKMLNFALTLGAKLNLPVKPLKFSVLHHLVMLTEVEAPILGKAFIKPDDPLIILLGKMDDTVKKQRLLLTMCNGQTLLQLIATREWTNKNTSDFRKAILGCFFQEKTKVKLLLQVLVELIKIGDLNLLKYIIEDKAEIGEVLNATLPDGQTPLSLAVFYNKTEIVKYLVVEQKANVSQSISFTLNHAAQTFLKKDLSESFNCFSENIGYDLSIFKNLLPLVENKSRCVYYVFEDSSNLNNNNANSFEKQFEQLMALSDQLACPALLTAKMPGSSNHFIAGLYFVNRLLLVNPLDISEANNFLSKLGLLQEKYDRIAIWLANNKMQPHEFEEIHEACSGPIMLEFTLHILADLSAEQLVNFINHLKEEKSTHHSETCSITNILPERLQLLSVTKNYKKEMIALRRYHFDLLILLPMQLAVLRDIKPDEYLNECSLYAPLQKIMNWLVCENRKISEVVNENEYEMLELIFRKRWGQLESSKNTLKQLNYCRFPDKFLFIHNPLSIIRVILLSNMVKDSVCDIFDKLVGKEANLNLLIYDAVGCDTETFQFIWNKLKSSKDNIKKLLDINYDLNEYGLFHHLMLYGNKENFDFFISTKYFKTHGVKLLTKTTQQSDNFIHLVSAFELNQEILVAIFQHQVFTSNLLELGSIFWSQNKQRETPILLAKNLTIKSQMLIQGKALQAFAAKLIDICKRRINTNNVMSSSDPYNQLIKNLCDRLEVLLCEQSNTTIVKEIRERIFSSQDAYYRAEEFANALITQSSQIESAQIGKWNSHYKERSYQYYDELIFSCFVTQNVDKKQQNLQREIALRTQLNQMMELLLRVCQLTLTDPNAAQDLAKKCLDKIKLPIPHIQFSLGTEKSFQKMSRKIDLKPNRTIVENINRDNLEAEIDDMIKEAKKLVILYDENDQYEKAEELNKALRLKNYSRLAKLLYEAKAGLDHNPAH